MPKLLVQAPIIEHKSIGHSTWRLTLSAPEMAKQVMPGQFAHIRIVDSYEPLLRRPLSFSGADVKAGTISVIYRVVGRGTQLLTTLKEGAVVDCMGPLGVGFPLEASCPLLVGGGMGLAPLVYLAEKLKERPVEILMGGRDKNDMFWPDYFKSCKKHHIATDDGSVGFKGFTSELLPQVLKGEKFDVLYTCGPEPMMKAVARIATEHNVPCYVSLEAHMACGVGACLSCTRETTNGKRCKVCTDGPVFLASEVFK